MTEQQPLAREPHDMAKEKSGLVPGLLDAGSL
jgi:hypothetical protein